MKTMKNSLAALSIMALSLWACGGSGGGSSNQQNETSEVAVGVSMLGFGDDVTFKLDASRNDAVGNYSSGNVTVSTASSSVPATGSATLTDVAFGNYDFSVTVYTDSTASTVLISQTFDNSGAGFLVDSTEKSFTLSMAMGDGDNITGIVSEFFATVAVDVEFDFPPEVTLTTTDNVEPKADVDGTGGDDYIAAEFNDSAVVITDYEEAGSTTGVDLCSIGDSSYVELSFAVQTSDGTSCSVDSGVSPSYYKLGSYSDSACGATGGSDCCRFRAQLDEADLGSCSSLGSSLTDFAYFVITVTGRDGSGNEASAIVNVEIPD